MAVAERIREERDGRGWTKSKATWEASLHAPDVLDFSWYERIESGRRSYLFGWEIDVLCKVFEIPRAELLALAGYA